MVHHSVSSLRVFCRERTLSFFQLAFRLTQTAQIQSEGGEAGEKYYGHNLPNLVIDLLIPREVNATKHELTQFALTRSGRAVAAMGRKPNGTCLPLLCVLSGSSSLRNELMPSPLRVILPPH